MARLLVWISCLWLSGCNQLFGIEKLKPAPDGGTPAANSNSGNAGSSSQPPDEDAGF